MLVVYSNYDESLVCEKKDEKKLLKEYFAEGGRILDGYDRWETSGVIEIVNSQRVSVSTLSKAKPKKVK